MLKQQPEEEFGPGINIREYSFLDNPSLPKQVNINITYISEFGKIEIEQPTFETKCCFGHS